MAAPVNRLKARMIAGERLRGIWVSSGSETVAEALSLTGFDWLLIDTEHGPIEAGGALAMLRACGLGDADCVVRVAWNDEVLIKRVLDLGAQTLMVPFVQTAEEASAAVRAIRYPLGGVRGSAGITRAGRWGMASDYLTTANDQMALIVQVETAEAAARIDEIAAVEGVDGVFIGPSDLSASMGHLGDPNHPEVVATIAEAAARIRAAGRRASILALDLPTIRRYEAMGFDMVAGGLDMHLLVQAARKLLAEME